MFESLIHKRLINFNTLLIHLPFKVRTMNIFARLKLKKVYDVYHTPFSSFTSIQGAGKLTISEVQELIDFCNKVLETKKEEKDLKSFRCYDGSNIDYSTNLQNIELSTRTSNIFNKLRLKTISDLINYTCDHSISEVEGVGQNTISEVTELTKYIMSICFPENKLTHYEYLFQDNIKEEHMELFSRTIKLDNYENPILNSELCLFDLQSIYLNNDLSYLDKANLDFMFYCIKENIKKNIEEVIQIISPHNAKFNSIYELNNFMIHFIDNLKETHRDVIKYRMGLINGQKLTLEETGSIYNITRERVRQIEAKVLKKIEKEIEKYQDKIVNTLDHKIYMKGDLGVLEIVLDYFTNKKLFVLHDPDSKICYVKSDYYNEFINILGNIDEEIMLNGYYDLENKLEFIATEEIKVILNNKYKIADNKIYAKTNLTRAIEDIIKNYGKALSIAEKDDVNYIRNTLRDNYDLELKNELDRNIETKLNATCVLWGPRKFIHPNNIKTLSNKLQSDIENVINTHKMTTAKKLFSIFKKELFLYDIDNPTALYGYIKYYYPDKYNFGGQSLVISILGENSDWTTEVKELILLHKRPITLNEVNQKYPAITPELMYNITANYPNIIYLGQGRFYLKELLIISSDEKQKIFSYIFQNKAVYNTKIYAYLQTEFPDLLARNFITNEKVLSKFIMFVYDDLFVYKEANNLICYIG